MRFKFFIVICLAVSLLGVGIRVRPHAMIEPSRQQALVRGNVIPPKAWIRSAQAGGAWSADVAIWIVEIDWMKWCVGNVVRGFQ